MLKFIERERLAVPIVASKDLRLHIPGKLIAMKQTIGYFKKHPLQTLTGTGMGNFSSKLAFRATAMNIAGGYPEKYSYISNAFKFNHLDLFLFYFTNKDDYHSIANSPNSVYDQLAAEYGLTGLLCFAFLYVWFFSRRLNRLSYGFPVLFLVLGILLTDYYFEQLSVLIFFELLLFLDIKETGIKKDHESE